MKEDRHFVTALARGLELLSCFRSGERLLGNQDLAKRCRLPKSTVSRLTYTLTKLGYLHYVESAGKYRLGSAALAIGSAMLARLDVRQLARPLMQDLADFTDSTVSLGMRDRLNMIYVENCRSQAALTLRLDVGSRIPLATTAMGRAYLAVAPANEREEFLDLLRESHPTEFSGWAEGIERAREEYTRLGCCTSLGDWQKDVHAIAVAFQAGEGGPLLSVNCGGPSFNLPAEFLLNEAKPRLLALVQRVTSMLLSR